jgi:hypothetical protein
LTTLILKDFLDTPYFHNIIETLKNSSESNITIKFKNNTGGLANLGDLLLLELSRCKACVNLVAEEKVISTAAYVWMSVYLDRKLYPKVQPTLHNGTALFTYHRPKVEEYGERKPIQEVISKELREKFSPFVKDSDICLGRFLNKHKDFTLFVGDDKTTRYSHEDAIDFYVNNYDIRIPIGILNNEIL